MDAIITKKRAKEIIRFDSEDMAHTFINAQFGLIGADHDKDSLFKDIDNAIECKKGGEQTLDMGHGLVIIPKYPCEQGDLLFVETKASFNRKELEEIKKDASSEESA